MTAVNSAWVHHLSTFNFNLNVYICKGLQGVEQVKGNVMLEFEAVKTLFALSGS